MSTTKSDAAKTDEVGDRLMGALGALMLSAPISLFIWLLANSWLAGGPTYIPLWPFVAFVIGHSVFAYFHPGIAGDVLGRVVDAVFQIFRA